MRHVTMKWKFAIFAVLIVLLITTAVLASTGFEISWWTADGGGGISVSGGNYSLTGTIGQAEAGNVSTGDPYQVSGGFWGNRVSSYEVFLPVTVKP